MKRKGGGWHDILSENDEVSGTEPVKRTPRSPKVIRVMPSERQKYSSSAV